MTYKIYSDEGNYVDLSTGAQGDAEIYMEDGEDRSMFGRFNLSELIKALEHIKQEQADE